MNSLKRRFLPGILIPQLFIAPVLWGDFINEDIQVVAPNATDFEVLLSGNKVNQIGTQFISPFNNGAQVNFNNATNTTVITFNAFDGQNFAMGINHFGFTLANAPFVEGGIGFGIPSVIAKLVTFPPTPAPQPPPVRVPALNPIIADVVNNGQVSVSLQNLSTDTFSLFQVGYIVTSTPFALSQLNRTDLPPNLFQTAGIPDGTQLTPGQSDVFNVAATPSQYITIFADTQFSGVSSGNAYQGVVGEWVESEATVTPEPASYALVLAAFVLGTFLRVRRNRS